MYASNDISFDMEEGLCEKESCKEKASAAIKLGLKIKTLLCLYV